MKKNLILLLASFLMLLGAKAERLPVNATHGGVLVENKAVVGAFPIVTETETSPLFVSPTEATVVKKAAAMFVDDVERVTKKKPSLSFSKKVSGKRMIVFGTLGNSPFIDKLVKQGKLNAKAIANGWEQYLVQVVKNPAKGIDEALVVAGSDKRGTAYLAKSSSYKSNMPCNMSSTACIP